MKLFVKKIMFFNVLTICVLLILIVTTNFVLKKDSNYLIEKCPQNIIIGHSHPEGAFNDSIILNTKNLSKSAEHYFYNYIKIKKIIDVNTNIKNIFLEFTNNHISKNMTEWIKDTDRNMKYIPIYSNVMEAEDNLYILNKDPYGVIKSQLNVLKNNLNYIFYNKKNILIERNWGGFYKNPRENIDSIMQFQNKIKLQNDKYQADYSNLTFINKIDSLCKKKGIKLFLIRSPLHKKYPIEENERYLQNVINNRFKEIPYLDFHNFELKDNEFADLQHLNLKGAKKFSTFFNKLLNDGLVDSHDPSSIVKSAVLNYNLTNEK